MTLVTAINSIIRGDFPNLLPKTSWIFPVRILQDPKSPGSCLDLCQILQISFAILLLGTVQEMSRFNQDPRLFLRISWHNKKRPNNHTDDERNVVTNTKLRHLQKIFSD